MIFKRRPTEQQIVDIFIYEGHDVKMTFKNVMKYKKKGGEWVLNPTYDRIVNKPIPFHRVKVKIKHKEKIDYEKSKEN